MLENYPRNPLVVLVFAFSGLVVRFMCFRLLAFLAGTPTKHIWSYSNGFKQMVYNLLLSFFLFVSVLFLLLYNYMPIG